MEMLAGRRYHQGDRDRVAAVGDGLCRHAVNRARSRCFKRHFRRKVNSVVNGSPRYGATNSGGGESGVTGTVFTRGQFFKDIIRGNGENVEGCSSSCGWGVHSVNYRFYTRMTPNSIG